MLLKNRFLQNQIKLQFQKFYQFSNFNETIFALSTPPYKSAISIVRVNGQKAIQSLQMIQPQFFNLNQEFSKQEILEKTKIKAKQINVKNIYDFSEQFNIIDQPLILYSPGPNSYTGEDMVEFHIHGSKAIQIKMLQELNKIPGFRLAEPGEFTQRALINNKLDLYEIEALHDLINSETESQRKMAANQFLGNNKEIFDSWKYKLSKCLAHVEAYIDFEEHESDVQENVVEQMMPLLLEIKKEMQQALEYQNMGELIKDGIKITLIGEPNVGKSSLLNLLSKRDISIISDIPGTTRDILQTQINLNGNQVVIYDTAGLRETENQIEKEGIKRALNQAQNSQIVVNLLDIGNFEINFDQKQQKVVLIQKCGEINNLINKNSNILNVLNKLDNLTGEEQKLIKNYQNSIYIKNIDNTKQDQKIDITISCSQKQNIDQFLNLINEKIKIIMSDINGDTQIQSESIILVNERQTQEIQNCVNCIQEFIIQENIDIIYRAQSLKSALNYLGKIQGRVDNEDILDILFKDFCIGK